MTTQPASNGRINPWLSAPLQPAATIRQVAASTSIPAFLVLCLSVGAATVVPRIFEAGSGWQDLAMVAVATLVAGLLGLLNVHLLVAALWLSVRLLAGNRTSPPLRNVVAWASVPTLWALLASAPLLLIDGLAARSVSSVALVLFGVAGVWSIVTLVLMLKEVCGIRIWRAAAIYATAAILLLGLALAFRVLAWQPFNIPSGAMKPTLLVGDYLFTSKYAYGYSRHSFPAGLASFQGRFMARTPERGDVVVFKLPRDNSTDYIKRVIGIPGDTIRMRSGIVYINDVAVPKQRVGTFETREDDGPSRRIPLFEEVLPNGARYRVLDAEPNGPMDNVGPFKVPPDHYFVMGDNRDNSVDSRMTWGIGFVPFDNIVGRADLIFMSVDQDGTGGRFSRLLTQIR